VEGGGGGERLKEGGAERKINRKKKGGESGREIVRRMGERHRGKGFRYGKEDRGRETGGMSWKVRVVGEEGRSRDGVKGRAGDK
jgi:hypothetical protein